jgi:DNA repair exonuclease SbcCD ATPase subunit
MTSLEIKRNLENIKQRTAEAQTRLKSEPDLDTALQVQRDLTDLQSYQSRLETELVATERAEALSKKKQDEFALETELAKVQEQHQHLVDEMTGAVKAAVPQFQELLGELKPLQSERFRLNKAHESLYWKRHGAWPQKGLVNGSGLLSAEGLSETERIVLFALELIDAEKTGHGTSFQDVLRALSSVSQRFGF